MRRVILANDSTLRLVRIPGEHGIFSFIDDLSAFEVRRYLEEYAGDHMAMLQLRMALAEDSHGMPVNDLDDVEVLEQVAERIEMGHLWIAEELEEPQPALPEPEPGSASSAAPPPELPRSKKLTWIEFQVVWDASAKPVKNVRLVVKTPDGVENYHDTNGEGKVRIEELEPGACDVRCDLKGAKLADTLDFVGMGSGGGSSNGDNGAPQAGSSTLRIAQIDAHKVKKGESIKSLATAAGMTWQELSKFNWGTDVPDEINKHLRDDVGCTKKTKDGNNYMFDDADDPGIMFIPRRWSQSGLATGGTHTIRVTTLRPGLDLVIPLEIDLDDDPDNDDQIRLREQSGIYDVVVTADSKQVREHDENPLALYRFRDVPPGKYDVSVNVAGEWRPVILGLEVTKDSVTHGGKKYESTENGAEFGNPEDPAETPEEHEHEEDVHCTH